MNRSESKYFRTAARMDEALLELLEQKDFAYITVKEICAKAGVNRSTFYLHYETIGELLSESLEYMNGRFLSYFTKTSQSIVSRLQTCPLEELHLVTPEYLTPYLRFVQDHKRLFQAAIKNSAALRLQDTYGQMFRDVFTPVLERYRVPERDREYMMAFYVQGLVAIVNAWMQKDCGDSIEHMIAVIEQCIPQKTGAI